MRRVLSDPIGAGFVLNLVLVMIYVVLVTVQWVLAAF
jgi:hypothetical protein